MVVKTADFKKQQQEFEEKNLNPYAAKSHLSSGRDREEKECLFRTEYQRDRDKILHNKAFRRLKHKTQVFISPVGDHYRTRMTHTLEVSQISRTIARVLRLNEDLVEAIALGHDLGHTPFGHTGEEVLNELLETGFLHNEQSVRVVDVIENLNLTAETKDGMLNHTGPQKPSTLEGQVVKIADRIAYLNHDIDDAIRANIITPEDVPSGCVRVLGDTKSKRITTMVQDIIENSTGKTEVTMSDPVWTETTNLRRWMFKHIYTNSPAKSEEFKARNVIEGLFEYFLENFNHVSQMPGADSQNPERTVADYIAGMTDRYAIQRYQEIFLPSSWKGDYV